jgi:hypothetical protein
MEDLFIGKNVIASSDFVYGFGRCLSKNQDGTYSVSIKRGYKIEGEKIKNLNDEFQAKIEIQDQEYIKFRDMIHDGDLYYSDIEGDEIDSYYNNFASLEESNLKEGEEKTFNFKEEEMVALEEECDNPRLIWSRSLTARERLDIIGKLLLDPAEYDNCIVGYDDDTVYYGLEEIVSACHYIMPNCDPNDNVHYNMIRACHYISSPPFIKFVEPYEDVMDRISEMCHEEESEEEVVQVSFNEKVWAIVD